MHVTLVQAKVFFSAESVGAGQKNLKGGSASTDEAMIQRPRIEGTHSLGLREIQAKRKNNSGHVQPAALLLLLAGATLARRVWPELDRVLLSGDIEA